MKLPNSIFDNFKSQLSAKPQPDTNQTDIKNSMSRNPAKDVGLDVPAP